ncbi:MAG: Sec-independent protein translocase subunit TatA [Gammaproteobacteria bacterium]|nr:Sec-independent protein translocase subunit TatA [Gammaproteobacteria bacterium]NNF62265.1 Sec-independent protein translocase subunit TatA [Gammaproteobacteria bacterium]NNM21062.1 Sec-independent protein translocase subunit TatA [Gammaproteobacteria bacterium]
MGLGNISIWQLAIVLLIVVLIFGTKKLRVMGSDLGGALRGFRKAMNEGESEQLTDDSGASDSVQQSRDQVDSR